jgi:hypothetical protein
MSILNQDLGLFIAFAKSYMINLETAGHLC